MVIITSNLPLKNNFDKTSFTTTTSLYTGKKSLMFGINESIIVDCTNETFFSIYDGYGIKTAFSAVDLIKE